MKKLIVGFSEHPGSLFSWSIKKTTASRVGHVYTRHKSTIPGLSLIFQASGLCVNYCNSKTFTEKSNIVEEYEIEITDKQDSKNDIFRQTELGKPYSAKQIYGFAWVLFMREYFNKKVVNRYANENKAYICVEVAAIQTGRIAPKDYESMTPEDLRRWCVKNGKLINKISG